MNCYSFDLPCRLIAKYRPTMPVISVVIPRVKTNQLKWSFSGAFEVCFPHWSLKFRDYIHANLLQGQRVCLLSGEAVTYCQRPLPYACWPSSPCKSCYLSSIVYYNFLSIWETNGLNTCIISKTSVLEPISSL